MAFTIRILINAFAIWLTTLFVSGFDVVGADTSGGEVIIFLVVGLIFGLINAIIKPVVALFSLPLYIITLGLFTLVVNALMLLLTAWITGHTDWGIRVDGFGTAVWAALIISVISFFVALVVPGSRDSQRRRRR